MSRSKGRRCAATAALAALLWLAAHAVGAQSEPEARPSPQPAQIDRNGVLILVRSTLLALQHANETGNYTVLRDLGAPAFRDKNTAASLSEVFAGQRAQKLDLSGAAALEPQLTILPQIEANGMMRMAGFFPSIPLQINFELLYAPEAGRWKLMGLAVNLRSASPTAPAAPSPPAAVAAAPPEKPKPARRPAPPRRPAKPPEPPKQP